MKLLAILFTLVISLALVGTVFAVPPGKTVEFDTPMGKVTFSGKIHADHGLKCPDCHSKIWKMSKTANPKMTMKELNEGKYCGTCHNGTKAFKTTECTKCHKK
jgi:c(7)-type cytochrome triheme protein